MRLKNKRTGEIGTLIVDGAYKFVTNFAVEDDEMNRLGEYASLAELNAEWEDYEEPKKYYVINPVDWKEVIGEIEYRNDSTDKINKEIGNYFESIEEAEKAVEKLKAWKRLKDSGFRVNNWVYALEGNRENGSIPIEIKAECKVKTPYKDLDLLFCTEDD